LEDATKIALNQNVKLKFPYENIECAAFKSKSRFIELPCAVGDTVYEISSGEVLNCTVEKIDISLTDIISVFIDISIHYPTYSATEAIETNYFGKTVFLTIEAAEKALERSEGK
jgi:hypothetical protein